MSDGVSLFSLTWQDVENLIVRPPRANYTKENLLGGSEGEFNVRNLENGELERCFRMDVEVFNDKGEMLVGSHYILKDKYSTDKRLPCVVICHGNAGCRVDANGPALALLSRGITCFCFDFSGCGLSQGEVVTLGAKEAGDLHAVVLFLREQGRTANLALWGRSMGATTSLIYASQNLSIAGLVLDSPFSRLTDLIQDIVRDMTGGRAPSWIVSGAIRMLRNSLKKRCNCDINSIDALASAVDSYQPALFIHAEDDELIQPWHSRALHGAYVGDKRIIIVGDGQSHNSLRPRYVVDSACSFLNNCLKGGLKDAEELFKGVHLEPPGRAPRQLTLAERLALQKHMQSLDGGGGDDDGSGADSEDAGAGPSQPQPPPPKFLEEHRAAAASSSAAAAAAGGSSRGIEDDAAEWLREALESDGPGPGGDDAGGDGGEGQWEVGSDDYENLDEYLREQLADTSAAGLGGATAAEEAATAAEEAECVAAAAAVHAAVAAEAAEGVAGAAAADREAEASGAGDGAGAEAEADANALAEAQEGESGGEADDGEGAASPSASSPAAGGSKGGSKKKKKGKGKH